MRNFEVANVFKEIADILEIKDENPFRIRAYRRAAQNIEALTEAVEELAQRGDLEKVPGIGKDLALKVQEVLSTGGLKYLENLKKEIPESLVEFLSIPGMGPKTAKLLYDQLGVDSVEKLEELAKGHKLQGLPGIRAKTEENILRGIELYKKGRERMSLGKALPLAQEIIAQLQALPEVNRLSFAGSLRRMKETVKDIDILVTSENPAKVMGVFASLPLVQEVLARGETKCSVILKEGIQADLRVVDPESFGAALQYFTGSKAHNIRTRELAVRKGLKLSEYGVFSDADGRRLGGALEEDMYAALGLSLIPPELREDTGEIEAALEGRLPKLVEYSEIKGDLHVHSHWSDGAHSLEELAEAAIRKGYEYLLIADHSKSMGIARGLSEEELHQQVQEIQALNKKFKGFCLLAGIEVDIRADGTLDFPDDVLAQLDIVVAAIHSGFKQAKETMTKRIVKVMENPHVHIIAHPTGRLIGEREGYELDWEEVLRCARETNTALEINSYPARLDLNDLNSRRAKEAGVSMTISTDAHTISQLETMTLGVATARRGWLTKGDLLNTLSARDLLKRISKK